MPKQLFAAAPRTSTLTEYQEKPLGTEDIRVQVEYASPKHGSELAGFRGESPHLDSYYDEEWKAFRTRGNDSQSTSFNGWNIGNQWVGKVTHRGEQVSNYQIGDRVCGYGGIRETHIVSANQTEDLFIVAKEMNWKNALCYDPAQFAMGGIRDSGMRIGDAVAISGLGAIGAIATQMAKLAGAGYVAVIDPIAKRREAALKHGADAAFDPTEQDVGWELKKSTEKRGVDVLIETSANERALQSALRGIAYGGTIAYVGWARAFQGGLDLGREAHFNNAKIIFSRSCSEPNPDHPRWSWARIKRSCWDLLCSNAINCEDIIDPVIPFSESDRGYMRYVDRHPEESVKLGVSFL